ncbi:glycoside hydrolase family 9 protein [Paenibacillus sp. 4624]|uniref:glycoside hydrolase family 9 protein n=1 Tax=Paenibacillus sp. 4624 TaxID=3156453 RepID=UPI003D19E323
MGVSVDNRRAAVTGSWSTVATGSVGFIGDNYIYTTSDPNGGKKVRWSPKFLMGGYYSVYANLPDGSPGRDPEAMYTIRHADGVFLALADQRTRSKAAYLGTFRFELAGDQYVELDNKRNSTSVLVNADAMIFVLEPSLSKQPNIRIKAACVSHGINRIELAGELDSPLNIQRVSNGKSFGVEVLPGTEVYYDYFAANTDDEQVTYRVGVVGKPGYAASTTLAKLAPVTVTPEIQITALGYKPGQRKEVFVKPVSGATRFSVISAVDGSTVQHMRNLETVNDPMMTSVLKGEFTGVTKPGNYRIKTDNGLLSSVFPIGDNIYDDFLRASLRNLRLTRWPETKIVIREDTNLPIDIGGGWEDAIDYKHWTSYNDTIQPFALMELLSSGVKIPGIEEELRYGLSYLLKIQERNPNGSGVMKFGQLAAAYSDIESSDSTPYILRVENIDLDNLGGYNKRCEHVIAHYLYALVLAKSAAYFARDREYSDRLKKQAVDAFVYMDQYDEKANVKYAEFFTTKDYFRALPVINYSYKALAAHELHKLTGKTSYRDKAKQALNNVVHAQKRDHKKTSSKITGLFAKDVGSSELMRSRIHAGVPLYALSLLSREITDASEAEWHSWHVTAKTFVDGFIKRFVPTTPYGVMPYGFGIGPRKLSSTDSMNYRFFQGAESEANSYSDGNTKMLALYAGALYEFAISFDDSEAARIADDQIEWIGGKNVFGTPAIAGIGEVKLDATKLTSHGYSANGYALVGTMVNGIDGGLGSDYPNWTNSWQTGETWGVNRSWMQFAVAQLTKLEKRKKRNEPVFIESVKLSDEIVTVGVTNTATVKIVNTSDLNKKVTVQLLADNATILEPEHIVRIKPGSYTNLVLEFSGKVADRTMLFTAMIDGKRHTAKSVLGFVQ